MIAVVLAARPAHADPGDRWDGVMILEQAAGGLGGAVAGGGLLMMAGAGLGAASKGGNDWGPPLAGALIGGSIGVLAGVTVGVKLTGDARGGNGGWGATIGGTFAGGLLTVATGSLYAKKVPPYVAVGLMTVTLLAPPILAYHLTSDENNQDGSKRVMVPLILSTF